MVVFKVGNSNAFIGIDAGKDVAAQAVKISIACAAYDTGLGFRPGLIGSKDQIMFDSAGLKFAVDTDLAVIFM